MADPQQLAILEQGVDAWNRLRAERSVSPDLSGADLRSPYGDSATVGRNLQGANFAQANLRQARLPRAELQGANLCAADLSGADLSEARFMGADLSDANLSDAKLSGANINDARAWRANFADANLNQAYLWGTDFREAEFVNTTLIGADLRNTQLVRANFRNATLVDCKVFGIAAWDLDLEGAIQQSLNINRAGRSPILVDNLEVAQFLYLILDNRRLRRIIDTVTSKVVLILGRFAPDRKSVLDALRDYLHEHDYVPVLFDFDLPQNRDTTETVTLLARMARFIVADLTAASSVGKELEAIVPHLAVPVQPLLQGAATQPYSMFRDSYKYRWVLEICRYETLDDLLPTMGDLISSAENIVHELQESRAAAEEQWKQAGEAGPRAAQAAAPTGGDRRP